MKQSFKPDRKYFKKVLWIQLTISIVLIVLIAIINVIIIVSNGNIITAYLIWILGVIILGMMWIITSLFAHLWIKNLEFVVHDDGVNINMGILTKSQKNIPFRMITDFVLERTLYDRMLGIGSIKIQTAGQSHQPSGYEGKLGGLVEYDKWHFELREKVKSLHPISESVISSKKAEISDENVLQQILEELREIRKNTS